MDPKELFRQAIAQATHAINKVQLEHGILPTPCTDWDLNDLVHHLLYEIAWVPDLLGGKTIAEVGDVYENDLGGDNPAALWTEFANKALAAVDAADLTTKVHLSYGDVTAEHYIKEIGGDVLIHTWDLCQSLWHSLWIEEAMAQTVYDFVSPRAAEFAGSGLFGTPVAVAADAPLQVRLLAFFGRGGVGSFGTESPD